MSVTTAGAMERVYPVSRTIRWRPLGSVEGATRPGADAPRICITQAALAQLEHDILSPGHPGIGFLLGALYRCPLNGFVYGVIDGGDAWPCSADDMLRAPPSLDTLRAALTVAGPATGRTVLGWYHVRGHLTDALAPDDLRIQRHVLDAPWQTTLIIAPERSGPTGRFFLLDPSTSRSYPAPFDELVDDSRDAAVRRSAVAWSGYTTDGRVSLLTPSERRAMAAHRDDRVAAVVPAGAAAGGAGTGAATIAAAPPGAAMPASVGTVGFPFFIPPRPNARKAGAAKGPRAWLRSRGVKLALLVMLSLAGTFAWTRFRADSTHAPQRSPQLAPQAGAHSAAPLR